MHASLRFLAKRYDKVRALDGVSLEIAPGQIVTVLGANGAGKTTLLRCLATITAPDSGEILFDGERLTRGNLELRRRLAFLPDFPVAYARHTVLRHIGMVLRLYGRDAMDCEDRALALLRGFDLLPLVDTPMGELSRGQAYKAALAALLTVDAELLLLDEPFASGMDPNGISFLKRELREAARRGRIVMYTTQILDIAERLSDHVCLLDHGQLRHYATLAELRLPGSGDDTGVLERLFQQLREDA